MRQSLFGPVGLGWKGIRPSLCAIPLLGASLVGCAPEGPSVMILSHLVTEEPEAPWGFECSQLGGGATGSSSSGTTDDEFWTRHDYGEMDVEIVAGSKDTVLKRKRYDLEFIQSGEVDRFNVRAPNGDRWTWVVWGGDECQMCPPGPYEPLPGDISECGSDAGAP